MPVANLLIVEDDSILARQLKLFFGSKGYHVLISRTREETLKILEDFSPEVCILDLGLPPLENSPNIGLSLLPYVAQKGVKVIVLTGQTAREAAVKAIALGAFDYIYKPADPQILDIAVNRALFLQEIEREIRSKEGKAITISRNPAKEEDGNRPLEDFDFSQGLNELKIKFERDLVEKALKSTGYNIVRTAKLLKISRESLYYLMKKHGIERPT